MRLCLCLALLAAMPKTWDFDKATVGQLPPGWSSAQTGEGPGSMWQIVDDGGKKVLAQTSSEGPDHSFNLCVVDDSSYRDLELSVAVKAFSGKNDRGGGVVWRYRDHDNYYIARWNPLEDNFRVYKVVGGKRMQLDTADVKLPTDRWHTLKITQAGDSIHCYLDGKQYLEAKDQTFPSAGRIGLWSKSDAVSHFDHFQAAELK